MMFCQRHVRCLFLSFLSRCACTTKDAIALVTLTEQLVNSMLQTKSEVEDLQRHQLPCVPQKVDARTAADAAGGDAVIFEPRRTLRLPLVLLNARSHLPPSFTINAFTQAR